MVELKCKDITFIVKLLIIFYYVYYPSSNYELHFWFGKLPIKKKEEITSYNKVALKLIHILDEN